MNCRLLFLAFVIVSAAAAPIVQTTKRAILVEDEDVPKNTFDISITFRVIEEEGEAAQERYLTMTDSLPDTVTLVSGDLVQRKTINSVENEADPEEGWTEVRYRICASNVAFSVANQTVTVVLPPVRVALTASQDASSEVLASRSSAPVRIQAVLPLIGRATLFAKNPFLTPVAYVLTIVLPLLLAIVFVPACAKTKDVKKNPKKNN